MTKSLKKKFNHLDPHTQLYLSAYEDQDRRHQLFRVVYKALAILAFLVPPVSLIFTIQTSIQDSKKKSFSLWKSIAFCLFFSLIPIASGFMSWNIIQSLEDSRRQKDRIQKVTYTQDEFLDQKQYFTQVKNKIREFDVDLRQVKPNSENKNHKVKREYIDKKKNCPMVDVYVDSAQRKRQ
jgi:hypothetical protein